MNEDLASQLQHQIASTILKQPELHIDRAEALISSGLIDSFKLVDLALLVEDTFGVHVSDTELNAETFDTIDQLAALIQERLAK
jgi:acyl carrier protein